MKIILEVLAYLLEREFERQLMDNSGWCQYTMELRAKVSEEIK